MHFMLTTRQEGMLTTRQEGMLESKFRRETTLPGSLLNRDDSLKMDKIFEPTSPAGSEIKKTYGEGQGSSAHLSGEI
jgi:hypothetical protein